MKFSLQKSNNVIVDPLEANWLESLGFEICELDQPYSRSDPATDPKLIVSKKPVEINFNTLEELIEFVRFSVPGRVTLSDLEATLTIFV